MSILVPFNGSTFVIPTPNEIGWGTNLDNYFVAIANGTLQNIGGSFTLSNDADFGGTNGLKSLYYKTRSANVASSGQIRLANAIDSISWRDSGNTLDLPLTVNSSNQLTFNGVPLAMGGSGTVLPGTQFQLGYYATSSSIISGLPLITANRALQSDSNGLPIASSVTATELGYLSGATSSIQAQLTGKKNILTGTPFAIETTTSLGNLQETVIPPSMAVVTDVNGLPSASVTTGMELSFVHGVTSAIQTQLNGKAPSANPTFTGQSLFADGTVAAPGIAFSSSPGTGLYQIGANDAAIATNGVKALEVNSSQQVDIANTKLLCGANQVFPIVQIVSADFNNGASSSTSTTFTASGTTLSITPKFSTSKIFVMASGVAQSGTTSSVIVTLFRNSTSLTGTTEGLAIVVPVGAAVGNAPFTLINYDSPATTSPTTYTVYFRSSGGQAVSLDGSLNHQEMMLVEIAQ